MDTTTTVIVVAVALAALVLTMAVVLLVRLVRTRRDLRRAGLPTGPRWVFWGAVLYLVLPTDLLPDPVYLDDIGVLLLALRTISAPLRTPNSHKSPAVTESKETNHSFDSYK
ncbi:YkvA family protein [Streptomyces sp. NPDC057257]|uniref:YkvA family protein n=1 Tax=Streptomyces sp. NPDC057257 TaxID=3346071 RepID=UPI00362C383E